MYVFPQFSSFFMFLVTFVTSVVLFTHIVDDPGIVCVLMTVYLLLHVGAKVTSLGCVTFVIITGISLCEIKLLYRVLPKIFMQFSNCFLFMISHFYLIHFGIILFSEFGFDKLKQTDHDYFSDITVVMFITFPLIISAIWTFVTSFYVERYLIPFVFQLCLFILLQILLRSSGRSNSPPAQTPLSRNCKEIPIIISVIQFMSGVIAHLLVLGYSMVFSPSPMQMWHYIIIDHLSVWALGLLYTVLLPTAGFVWNNMSGIANKHIKGVVSFCAISCYILLLPFLSVHGVHFHLTRLIFFIMVILAVGFSLVMVYPRKLILIVLAAIAVLITTFLWEMPWGIQLLPRTTYFLEKIYFSIIFMAVAALIGAYFLSHASGGQLTSFRFDLSLFVLVTVFHAAEWNLYFTNLVSSPFLVASLLFVLLTELCFASGGRITATTTAAIESQLVLKLIVLVIHCSTEHRISLSLTSVLVTLIIGFILSHSLKTKSEFSWIVSVIKGILLFLSIVVIRDSILMLLIYGITGEEILSQLNIFQCLFLSLLLDFISNWNLRTRSLFSKPMVVRVALLMTASCILFYQTMMIGVVAIAFYALLRTRSDKWDLSRVVIQSFILATGCALILFSLVSPDLIDMGLSVVVIAMGHIVFQLVLQPSVRIFKRYFMRVWVLGIVICVLELAFGRNSHIRFIGTVGFHLGVTVLLGRSRGCLENNLDSNLVILDLKNVLTKIQTLSILQCFFGGIIACRFNFSSPQVLLLPFAFYWLKQQKCICEYRELISKQVNVISLIVSSLGILLFLSTVQQSPLLITSTSMTSVDDLSLQLDLAIIVQAWFEMVLSCLLAILHLVMVVLSTIVIRSHDCAHTKPPANLEYYLIGYSAVIPISLGFIFCSTSVSSVALAFLSFSAGTKNLLL